MYKLLVVDDEQIVLDAVKFIVNKNFDDIVITATAKSGREAIEKADMLRPDLVLMDIKMPGINGIEAVREIRNINKNTLFIIISAYEQFDYAREAVNLGVIEYISKPINRIRLVEAIKKCTEIIKTEREKKEKELEIREKLENIIPILEHSFIYSIIMFDDYTNELEKYVDLLNLTQTGGYIITVEFGEEEENDADHGSIGFSIKSQSFQTYFRDILSYKCKCIIGPIIINRISVFVPSDFSRAEYDMRLEALKISQYLYESLLKRVDIKIQIGIGGHKDMDNLSDSYRESLKALRYQKGKGIVHIMDIPVGRDINPGYPSRYEKLLIDKSSVGDTEGAINAFIEIFQWILDKNGDNMSACKGKVLELMIILHRLARDCETDGNNHLESQDFITDILNTNIYMDIRTKCMERIKHISELSKKIRDKKISAVIKKSREYIENNFNREITLEDVSRQVNISPHYFSRLFKDETGENFIEYLTAVRIKKAKELMANTSLSIKEICFETGYGDPNYFSRLFKKLVGVTPSEYIKSID